MKRVRLKQSGLTVLALINLISLTVGFNVERRYTSKGLSFEMCSPYDSVFELNYINIDSCTSNPCLIPIGKEVVITGSFTYSGDDMEKDAKLKHRPNWLLNYVYTSAKVVENANVFSSSDQFEFKAVVYVDESLAPLKGTLNWRLYDEDENRIACYNIPIQLTL